MSKISILKTITLFIILLIFLSNSNNPPEGKTGAPGEGLCSDCHSGGTFTGDIEILGLPSTVSPNTVYPLIVEVNNYDGNAARSGFQVVALNGSNNNIGNLSTSNANVVITSDGTSGRTYAEHNPAINFSGGTTSYTFDWTSPSSETNVILYASGVIGNGNSSNNDNVVQTNASTIVVLPTSPEVSLSPTHLICNNRLNGEVFANVTSGTPPYGFLWSNNMTTNPITGLAAGTYTVTVTDDANTTATASITLNQPNAITVTISNQENANCLACDGVALVNAFGGTGSLSYEWSNGNSNANPTNLCSGLNTVTVTDANNCSKIESVMINAISTLQINNILTMDVLCQGENNGSATVAVSGGDGNYSYSWSSGGTSMTENNLAANNYSLTVSDSNGCLETSTFIIDEPTVLSGNIITTNETANGATDGTATVSVQGGNGTYMYNWNNSETTATINNLVPGIYTVTITDLNNCSLTLSGSVAGFNCDFSASITETISLDCQGDSDGELQVNVSGGTSPFSYNWSNGAVKNVNSGLIADAYSVTVTDAANCIAIVNATLTEPSILNATIIEEFVIHCYNGSDGALLAIANGGTAPYSYLWSNGTTTNINSNLSEGTYIVTITDTNNCESIAQMSLSEPDEIIVASSDVIDELDAGMNGSIQVSIIGGNAPYIYSWSNGENTPMITNLSSGTYDLIIEDARGCSSNSFSFTVGSLVDILDLNLKETISISPNPANGFIQIKMNQSIEKAQIKILNVQGKLITDLIVQEDRNRIDVSHLNNGIYFIRVQVDNLFYTTKFLIKH